MKKVIQKRAARTTFFAAFVGRELLAQPRSRANRVQRLSEVF